MKKGFAPLVILVFVTLLLVGSLYAWRVTLPTKTPENLTNTPAPTKPSCLSISPNSTSSTYNDGNLVINFNKQVPKEMEPAIVDAIKNKPESVFSGIKIINITSARLEDGWSLVSIGAFDGPCYSPEHPYSGKCALNMAVIRKQCGEWEAALQGSDNYEIVINKIPETYLNQSAKKLFINSGKQLRGEWEN